MKQFGVTFAALAMFGVGAPEARELDELLKEKGVITDEEYSEVKKTQTPKGTPLYPTWDKGLKLVSPDGNIKISIGGRAQNDWAIFDADDDLETFFGDTDEDGVFRRQEFGSGTEFRRVRLEMGGDVYKNAFFKVQIDFAEGAELKDVYMGMAGVPFLGEVTLGHYKEPFSLEELTSSKYITFMERSLPNAFAPGRNTGIGFMGTAAGERVTYAGGFFRDADDFGAGFGENDDYNFTTRLTGLPAYAEDGRRLVHLGFAYSHQTRDSNSRFRERPEAHLSPVRFVDTGSFDATSLNLLGFEAASVFGPVSIQGEYIPVFTSADSVGDPDLMGWYVLASYFLTGENRAYKPASAAFDRVKPNANLYDGKGGLGALELAARYSALDLSDADIDGGEMQDFTFGVNWYWNPNMRIMLNYVYSDLEDVGEANIFQARFAVDF